MAKIEYDNAATRTIKKRQKKYPNIVEEMSEVVSLFEENPRHPSLQSHKIKSKKGMLTVRLKGTGWRLYLRHMGNDLYVLFDVRNHDGYDK